MMTPKEREAFEAMREALRALLVLGRNKITRDAALAALALADKED